MRKGSCQTPRSFFDNGRYARAYALAFTALEEISKSQMAADVFTGFIDEEEFWAVFRDHRKKIDTMGWASDDASRYVDGDERFVEIYEPSFAERNDALYVNFNGEKIQHPEDVIGQEQAKSIIHTVRVAIAKS